MKHYLAMLLLFHSWVLSAQPGLWTWISGDTTYNGWGKYGPKGMASDSIYPPSRTAAISWTDTGGNFWLYGGATPYVQGSPTTSLADLWKFDPLTNRWTYMGGTKFDASTIGYGDPQAVKHSFMNFDSVNCPGAARSSGFTWLTPDNHLWFLNALDATDFWQYDPAINQWAWMGDWDYRIIDTTGTPGSSPGIRKQGCAWVDKDGNLWMFGGYKSAMIWQGYYSEFLCFDRQAHGWVYKAGPVDGGQPSAPGPLDSASTAYTPGSRACYTYWQDADYNFYLSGGTKATGPFNGSQTNYYQDVWRYKTSTREWTLQRGTALPETTAPQWGLCAFPQNPIVNTRAGARFGNTTMWKICDDLIVFYGGNLYGVGYNRDLYAYVPSKRGYFKLRTFVPQPHYGEKGVADFKNYPHVSGGSSFLDKQGNLWLFGGDTLGGISNALWKFTPDTACFWELTTCYSRVVLNDVPSLENEANVQIFPNPSSVNQTVTLKLAENWIGGTATINSLDGKICALLDIMQTEIHITPNLPKGLYFVTVQRAGSKQSLKFVVL